MRPALMVLVGSLLAASAGGALAQEPGVSAPDTLPSADVPAAPQESAAARGVDSLVGEAGMTPEELDDLTARVAAQLRCPVCRNQSVLESSATLSQEMQAEIRRRLASGDSPEEVRAYFVDRYGEWILLRPKAEGINLLVYLLPAAALLLGGFLVWRLLLTWSGGSADDAPAGPDGSADAGPAGAFEGGLDPEEERRLEAVLRGEGEGGGGP